MVIAVASEVTDDFFSDYVITDLSFYGPSNQIDLLLSLGQMWSICCRQE